MITARDCYNIIMREGAYYTPRTIAVNIEQAVNYVLACDHMALYSHPSTNVSAMDGYAVAHPPTIGDHYHVIGESAAGTPYDGDINSNQAIRIFTGAYVPNGACYVVIQEHVTRHANNIVITNLSDSNFIRHKGLDFKQHNFSLPRHTMITSRHVGLLAMMGYDKVTVYAKPNIAILSTGNELCWVHDKHHDDDIIASNSYSLYAQIKQYGGNPSMLGIAADDRRHIYNICHNLEDIDIVITSGGASVGDYDYMAQVVADLGLIMHTDKVAMRPGKPFLFGVSPTYSRFFMGFAGNPVSSYIGACIFLRPLIQHMLGYNTIKFIDDEAQEMPLQQAIEANDQRQEYARAIINDTGHVHVMTRQDSALVASLAQANALVVRPPYDNAKNQGDMVQTIKL